MKITAVNTYYVRPRWGFVEIETDEGFTGWGEAVLEGHCDAVLACVKEYAPYLIGHDPARIEDIWNTIYRAGFYRGGGVLMSAISGIDQALWDIKGKVFGAPVYQLMGGACRDSMRVYSWIGGDRPDDTGAAAKERKDAGFTAIKMNATEELQMVDSYDKIDAVLARVAAIRETCGKYFGIAIDFHGRVHKPMAKILAKKLEEFDPMFIEEPVLCESMECFKEIAASCNIPIATGERLFSRYDFKRLLQAGAVAPAHSASPTHSCTISRNSSAKWSRFFSGSTAMLWIISRSSRIIPRLSLSSRPTSSEMGWTPSFSEMCSMVAALGFPFALR